MDAEGRLEWVRIGFTWDQQLAAAELPAAVLAAVAEAKVRQVEQYGDALRDLEDEPAPPARPARPSVAVLEAFDERVAAGADGTAVARELAEDVLMDVRAGLDEANRLLDEHAGRTFTARSTSGHVAATALGNGDVDSLDLDLGWVSRAHPANLGREITEAMLAATRRARREGLAAAIQASRLADIARRAIGATTTPEGNDR
ncbi:hypothetical protein [Nocardioides sp. URHA0032]|uniref:hypothetical protein n=1 Tax=Nocardioides sp. URHA0032 TaxID=1380388 RepID=UPI0005649D22|nr:hypothetical protein [Nocardioides sp. URHA0032]